MVKSTIKSKKRNNILREKMPVPLEKPPSASSENVSKSMKGNISRDTKPEITLRKALYSIGIRGYRVNWKKVPGSPDICFVGKKIALFVNGCYWHRCPKCNLPLPKTNRNFWNRKFNRNIERDKLKKERLINMGWMVLTIWECEIKKDIKDVITRVAGILN